jgi:hypothetical protein
MVRRITPCALILLAGCAGGPILGGGRALSYAQYASLEENMTAEAILKAFGPADDVRQEDGKVRGLTYACEDESGKVLQLRMAFSAEGRLQKWVLRDPRAPEPAPATPPGRAAS